MRRQTIRMRQEFLERKQHESVHDAIHTRKQQFNDALNSGAPLPGHLKKDSLALKKFTELDDAETGKRPRSTVDDEYASAGVSDPRILVTTSRDPSQKLQEFAKEVRLIFPNAERLNRGSLGIGQVMEAARRDSFTEVIMLQETRGVPDSIAISHLPLGPTVVFTIHNIVTRHDIEDVGTMSEAYPHLVFENFSTPLGHRIQDVLKYLFPVPKAESARVITFDNSNDFISFRHHTYKKVKGGKGPGGDVILSEVGPRFELTPYRITLGTLEMADADTEWVLKPYMNTSKKRTVL